VGPVLQISRPEIVFKIVTNVGCEGVLRLVGEQHCVCSQATEAVTKAPTRRCIQFQLLLFRHTQKERSIHFVTCQSTTNFYFRIVPLNVEEQHMDFQRHIMSAHFP
jgi:hypothetical protein